MISSICEIFKHNMTIIPEKYREEFEISSRELNLSRERLFSIILMFWHTLMAVYLFLGYTKGIWIKFPSYKYLFIIHIVALVYYILNFFILCHRKNSHFSPTIENTLDIIFIIFMFQWCAISVLFTANQLSSYAIGIIFISSSLLIKSIKRIIFLGSGYITLVIGTMLIHNDYIVKEQYIINGAVLIIAAVTISKAMFDSYAKDFINKKVIKESNIQLENSQKILEDMVEKKTQELVSTTQKLIKEINGRHAMELQVCKVEMEKQQHEQLLEETRKYEQIKQEFFANVSHELRTPINIIFCTVQMFKMYLKNGVIKDNVAKIEKHVESMMQNCYRLIRLINNLIDITKIDSGFIEVELSNNDIVKICKEITLSTVHYFKNLRVTLSFCSDIEEKIIACDPYKLDRILLNLLSNAAKFTLKGGSVFVRVYEKENFLFISVRDTGIGIDEDKLGIIFERFQQVNKFPQKAEGSGIGLSIVKSLVELHHGEISVVSEVGKGSEFIIKLPCTTIEDEDGNCDKLRSIYNNTETISMEFSNVSESQADEGGSVMK